MTKQLQAYYIFITNALSALNGQADENHLRHLIALHETQIQAFAHERLIHLLVTFFFALVFFACIICTSIWTMWQFLSLDFLLTVLLLFYIKHYFFLENTVQKLYPITQQLYHWLDHNIKAPAL